MILLRRFNHKNMIDVDECKHDFEETKDGMLKCSICELILKGQLKNASDHPKNYPSVSTSKTSVLDMLKGVPEEIKIIARNNMIKNYKKVRNDKKNTFFYIYGAYQQLGVDFCPNTLCELLGLERKDINNCIKNVSGTSLVPGSQEENMSIVILSPVSLIPELCVKNDLQKHSEKIKQKTKEIISQKDILYSSKPKHVACAIIKKYCDVNKISAKNFGKTNKLSDNALKRAIKEIEEFFK